MEIVRDVKTFVRKNGEQMKKLFIYKTGIRDQELVQEHLQDFYVKMIQTGALESYKEDRGTFENYIFTLMCWLMPQKAKKNVSIKYKFVSQVYSDPSKFEDVWEHAGCFDGPYRFDFCPCTPRIVEEQEETTFTQYLKEFKEYIVSTEAVHSSDQMITFLNMKEDGCRSSDIAIHMGVSDTMVKFIKQKVQRKFERWKMLN